MKENRNDDDLTTHIAPWRENAASHRATPIHFNPSRAELSHLKRAAEYMRTMFCIFLSCFAFSLPSRCVAVRFVLHSHSLNSSQFNTYYVYQFCACKFQIENVVSFVRRWSVNSRCAPRHLWTRNLFLSSICFLFHSEASTSSAPPKWMDGKWQSKSKCRYDFSLRFFSLVFSYFG